jgi:cation diffusion facilitator family transporter
MIRRLRKAYSDLPDRDRSVVRVLGVIFLANWTVAAAKIAVGALSGRLTVIADGLHGLLDGANNVLGAGAIVAAARPPDSDHPYGHRKFENVAAMFIGALIALVAWEVLDNIARTVWRQMTVPETVAAAPEPVDWLFVAILAGTLVINGMISFQERRHGERLDSPLLLADASHTLSDCGVTAMSLASLIVGGWAWWVDPLLALGVMVFLVRASWGVIAENLPAITDRAQLDPKAVARVARGVKGVLNADGVRSRGAASEIHADLRLELDGDLTAAQAEAIETKVRRELRAAFPGLTFVGIRHVAKDEAEPKRKKSSAAKRPVSDKRVSDETPLPSELADGKSASAKAPRRSRAKR